LSKFKYKARNNAGQLIQGEIEAPSQYEVTQDLTQKGLTPIVIEDKPLFLDLSNFVFETGHRISTRELSILFRQLAAVISAGIPFFEALSSVESQISDKKLQKVLLWIKKDIESGSTFSQALAQHPRVFSPLIVALVEVGEKGGVLDEVLKRISAYLEKESQFQNKIKAALRYPIMVISVLAAAFVFSILLIIPRFQSLFGAYDTALPLPTRILLGINFTLTHYWWLILILGAVSFFVLRSYLNSTVGRKQWDGLKLKLPVWGPLLSKIAISRFFRMLTAMISSGIPIVESLEVTEKTADNVIISEDIDKIRQEVVAGGSLSVAMKKFNIFPSTAVQMIAVGEQSGNLESMLMKSADYFDEESDFVVSNLMSLIEPFLIFVLALFVLLLALGIFLPMWSLFSLYTG